MRIQLLTVTLCLSLSACGGSDLERPATPPTPTTPPSTPSAPSASNGSALQRDVIIFGSDRSGNYQIYTMRTDGTDEKQLTRDEKFDTWWPRVSPDRKRILFHRSPKGVNDRDYTKVSLWVMNADGSGVTELRAVGADGWALQGHAEWSPDGRQLVMFGGKRINPQFYVTDLNGREPRAITARSGQNLDPAWSPDGGTIVFAGCPSSICFERDYEVYKIGADGKGEAVRLTNDKVRDHDPYFSPDGKRIAWLTQTSTAGPVGVWNIRIANAYGSNLGNVTNDDQINSKPAWSLDGATIFFHRLDSKKFNKFAIYSIRPDGTGMAPLTLDPSGNYEYPSQ